MSVIIKSGSSSDTASVDGDNNLKVNLPTQADQSGYARLLDSDGDAIITTENGALTTSSEALVVWDQVDGAAINTNIWSSATDTMTITQANGYITLNAGASTAANKYAILQTIKSIPLYAQLPLHISFNVKTPVQPQSNATMEIGIGVVSGASAPTDGAFFRWTSTGEFRAVVNNGGSETQSSVLTPPANNDTTLFEIVLVEDLVQFFIDDTRVAEVEVPLAQAYPTSSGRLPIFLRVYTGGSVPIAAPQLALGQMIALQEDMTQNKAWPDTLATLGRGAYQSPITPFGQTANHANSTSPSSATLSNTAAGYSTLGGRFQFAAVAAAATDFALFAYQVPAGYQLFVTGITISTLITGTAIVTTTVFDWSMGLNASAVSLATADGAGTWAPRRVTLGMQSFAALSAIGVQAPTINTLYTVPLVVDAGRFLHVILQVPNGAATGSLVFRGDVQINGYFE